MNALDTRKRFAVLKAGRVIALTAAALASIAVVGQGFSFFCGNHIADGRQCQYSVNPNCLDAPTPDQEEAAINAAGTTWTNGGANFRFTYLGRTNRSSISPGDNRQDIFWRNESSGGALAVTVCNGASVAFGADILFYDLGWTWQLGGSLDIQTVALHEMGHLLGLGHSSSGSAVMQPSYHGIDRDLATDDVNGLIAIYGASGPPPDLQSIVPASGQVRGGTEVTLNGTNFADTATVTFDGVAANVRSRTGSTQIVVDAPAGTSIGQTADVRVTQSSGADTLFNAFTYGQNATDLSVSGSTRVGAEIEFVLYGEANRKAWLAVGPPGEFSKAGITICATTPFRLRVLPPASSIGPVGEKRIPWTIVGSAFETLHAQGVVRRAGGVFELTPCVPFTVFP